MATGHRSSSNWVLIPAHCKKILNPRIQPHGVSTARQREQGGRAPHQRRRSIFGKGRPSGDSIFLTLLPPLTRLRGDFPHTHLPRGAGSERTQRSRGVRGRARRSAVTCRQPRGEAPRCPGCGGMPGRGDAHSHPRTRTLPAAPPAPAFRPERRDDRRTPRPSGREQSAGRRRGAWRPTVTRPSGLARPLPPPPPHAPRVAASPLTSLTFPLTGRPAHSPSGSLSRRKVPGIRRGKAPNSMTRWVSSSPHSPRNRPLEPSPKAILPPNTIYSRTNLLTFKSRIRVVGMHSSPGVLLPMTYTH